MQKDMKSILKNRIDSLCRVYGDLLDDTLLHQMYGMIEYAYECGIISEEERNKFNSEVFRISDSHFSNLTNKSLNLPCGS